MISIATSKLNPRLNPKYSCRLTSIGRELTPLLVIDNCLAEPEQLRDFARCCQPEGSRETELPGPLFAKEAGDFYPGLRCPLPDIFGQELTRQLAPLLRRFFISGRERAFTPLATSLSLAGVKRQSLRPIQSLPHFDDSRDDQLAMVLYLFQGDLGGTGFYRHISTGFERITQPRMAQYAPQLKAEAMAHREILGRYMGRENALFAATEYVEPAFNRAVIYPSNCLHSGVLHNDMDYSLCVQDGRLTANMLIICNEV